MLDLDKKFGTDKGAENDGVWVKLESGENSPGFKIARTSRSNKKYTKALSKAYSRNKRALELKTLSDEKAEEIELTVFVDTVLKDWRGISVKGKKLEFNRDNAIKVLTSYPDLYDFLKGEADSLDLFKNEEMESAAKN